ncbi:MAG: NAD(P)/FAD-dependent oxidoreductase [Sulfolobales archaeon]|nr:NAD(P)/FAD-dependent oxidoreductase [Sulfolobales archaeon]MCX8185952.1 NAD(P)/FAD-dependent oxidoreductase [Sulfolobales archaeon]MDW7969209.1 NAD(P)/FAD-dependent oxidoreductase [Sulfolobales archaeon]
MRYDVVIVGAGPAGLFSAYELVTKSEGKLSVALIDKGPRASMRKCPLIHSGKCMFCKPCLVLSGIGGAGALSSFLINLRPDIGGELHELVGSWEDAYELIKYVDSVIVNFSDVTKLYLPNNEMVEVLEKRSIKAGATFISIPQRHIGSERAITVLENFTKFLEGKGVKILTNAEVVDIAGEGRGFTLKLVNGEISCDYLILATGRSGAEWFSGITKKLGVSVIPGPLDVGVRVEVQSVVMDEVTKVVRDPKIIMYTKAFDDKIRTFCTNPGGFVIKEVYDDGTVGVNGESYNSKSSGNTNFALLSTVRLTNPLEDTVEYGKSIARLSTKLGGGKPLIQRFSDLEAGRRSTWDRINRSSIRPTLKDVTPGDISMALPYRVLTNIIEGLQRLDNIIPGVASSQTLVYAPEIKYYSVRAVINKYLESSVENVFVAGDGAGLSRGINVAAATGVLAGRGVLHKLGII